MTLRVGILGFAHGHVATYCQQWRQNESLGINVTLGWDHDPARAAKAQADFRLARCESAEALVSSPAIDAVVIGAETSLHGELVEKAAASGKSIVLQKPIALTLAQADQIVAAVARYGVPFTLAWQMRVDPQNQRMKQWLEEGKLGRVYMLRRRHGLNTHLWPEFQNSWHVKPELNRGMWADDACHAIDFVYWLLGKPQSVMAQIATLHNPRVPDDHGLAIYRYADGTIAEVSCSFVCCAAENTTEIFGAQGSIIQNFGDVPSCNAPRPAGGIGLKWFSQEKQAWTVSDIASPPQHGQRIAAVAPELAAFLHGRRAAIATAEEGRDVLRLTLAAYRSSELGRLVNIDEVRT